MKPSSWLCRDDWDRERMLDMEQRLAPVRRVALAIIGGALLLLAPWVGWWTILPLVLAAGLFRYADSRLEHVSHPEYIMFGAWAGSEVMIAAAVALTGGPLGAGMSWFAIPIVTLSARFPLRGVIVGMGTALALMFAVAFGVNAQAVIDNPVLVAEPFALMITVALLSTALMHSDVHHRSEAVIDQLTGMLNRKALENRVIELSQQSEVTGVPVGLILADLDNFKEINDTFGHATGDSVLKDVAYTLRKQLRAFDLSYRIGGEEFLVLLPGADLEQACLMAEELRAAVAEQTQGGGFSVTISLGVSASSQGSKFDYADAFADADARLYEAKRSGRNRVCTGGLDAAGTV